MSRAARDGTSPVRILSDQYLRNLFSRRISNERYSRQGSFARFPFTMLTDSGFQQSKSA